MAESSSAGSRTGRAPGGSAGMPDSEDDPRITELEARLAALEGGPGVRERGRKVMDRIVPPEASRHFRNAGREQLLGIRTIVDHWISRIDDHEPPSGGSSGRQTIEVD
jgi:hypothetical protein